MATLKMGKVGMVSLCDREGKAYQFQFPYKTSDLYEIELLTEAGATVVDEPKFEAPKSKGGEE
jgi:hypothetical protein